MPEWLLTAYRSVLDLYKFAWAIATCEITVQRKEERD